MRMIEAVVQATPQPAEAARVLALYAQAQASPETEAAAIAEADKLTFEMIEETAEWLKVPKPKNPEQARKKSELAKGANCVRAWWLDQVKKLCGEREAREFTRHWEEAFAEAAAEREEADFAEKLDAETARLAKAKAQPEPEGDKKISLRHNPRLNLGPRLNLNLNLNRNRKRGTQTLRGYLGKLRWIAQSCSPQRNFINAALWRRTTITVNGGSGTGAFMLRLPMTGSSHGSRCSLIARHVGVGMVRSASSPSPKTPTS
jgi:hypothetical protein